MSKTVTATLPAALLVIFWWQRGRLEWRRDVLPLAAVVRRRRSPAGLFTAWVESTPRLIGAQGRAIRAHAAAASPAGRPRAVVLRLESALAGEPDVHLSSLEDRSRRSGGSISSRSGLAALAVASVCWRAKNRGPLAGFLIFTGTLFPVLGFLNVYPFRYSYVADHFQYLAILAIIVPAAAGLTILARRLSPRQDRRDRPAGSLADHTRVRHLAAERRRIAITKRCSARRWRAIRAALCCTTISASC